jgi:phage terminase large subunit-like protein
MRQQSLNAAVVESARGARLVKPAHTRKIDSLVALSMACAVAVETPEAAPARLWGV